MEELERHHATASDRDPRSFGAPIKPQATGTTTGGFNLCASNPSQGSAAWIGFFVNTLSTGMDTYYHESLNVGGGTYTLPVAQLKDLAVCVANGTVTWNVQYLTGGGWTTISGANRIVAAGFYAFYENTSGACGQRRARVTNASGDTYNVSGSVRNFSSCSI